MGKAKELAELANNLTVSGGAVTVSGFNYDNIVASAPGALDTLNELAAAIGDDANFSTTVTNSIATKLPLAGGTMTGNLTLGDNVKIEIGSNSGGDLQIYHDGNSKIADVGGGKLELHSDGTGVFIQKGATEYMAKFETDGAVTLYHDNSPKLATTATGVDITGVTTSTGFSGKIHPVNGTTTNYLSLKDGNELNFYNSSDASQTLHINYDGGNVDLAGSSVEITHGGGAIFKKVVQIQGDNLTTNLVLRGRSTDQNFYTLYKSHNGSSTHASFGTDASNDTFNYQVDNHAFQNLASNTTYMKINSSGHVGIGTTSPLAQLEIDPPAVDTPIFAIRRQDNASIPLFKFFQDSSVAQGTGHAHMNTGNRDLSITADTNSTKTLGIYLKTTGQVGIGTDNPGYALDIEGPNFQSSSIRLTRTDTGTSNDPGIYFVNNQPGTNGGLGGLWFTNSYQSGNAYAMIRARTQETTTSGKLQFITSNGVVGNATPAKMTINHAGDILYGGRFNFHVVSGFSAPNVAFQYDFYRGTYGTPIKVTAAITHWNSSYMSYTDGMYWGFNTAMTSNVFHSYNGGNGSWTISFPTNNIIRVRMNGDATYNYASGWYIKVEGNLLREYTSS